ncbi:MAG TPA: hypothetical protein VK081_02410, partial [Planctomycetota bacterium]|nr:hypothetical protein [Planctomycetota bacterium]
MFARAIRATVAARRSGPAAGGARRGRRKAARLAVVLLLGGCASPEPRAEVEAAAALAGERSGAAVDWTDAPAAGAPRALPAGPLAERDSVA